MRKTVTITIGGALFHIEDDAYDALDAYLRSIRSHFSTFDEHEEIVADIEGRIAEEFTDLLKENKRAAINEIDVKTVCANMGSVEDFQAFESDGTKGAKDDGEKARFGGRQDFGKKLYRDSEDPMIAGVASGIAQYVGIEPWIVRVIFAASMLFGGAGVFLYVILWIVIPEAKTIGDKTEMRGGRLTLERIEATIREKVPAATKNIDKGKIKKAVELPFLWLRAALKFVGRMLRGIIPFLGRILGVLICAGAMAGMFFVTFWLIIFMTGSWEQYMDVPVRELAGNATFYAGLVCVYLLLIIPGIGLFAVGMSLSKMKNAFTFNAVLALGIVWLSTALFGAVLAASHGPAFVQKVEAYVEDFRTESTKDIPLSAFTNLDASHNYGVIVRKGTTYTMKASGSERAMERLRTSVENGTLTIRQEGRGAFCIFCLDTSGTIEITTPAALGTVIGQSGVKIDIDGVPVNGDRVSAIAGSNVDVHNSTLAQTVTLETKAGSRILADSSRLITNLTVDSVAGSRVEYTGNATTVKVDITAGSRVVLLGSGTTLKGNVIAGSRLEASGFTVKSAEVHTSAGGRATLNVVETLSGSANAGGHIEYGGNPTVNVESDPSGDVSPVGGGVDEGAGDNDDY